MRYTKPYLYTRTPATSTQMNSASDSRKSPTLKSGLQTSMPALLDASWNQKEFSDHLYCSLISSTSVELQILQFLPLNLRSSPGRPGRSRDQKHGRYLYRPCLDTSGTSALPCSFWPGLPRDRISNRNSSCQGCCSPGTHGYSQGTWIIGRLPHARVCGTQPTWS